MHGQKLPRFMNWMSAGKRFSLTTATNPPLRRSVLYTGRRKVHFNLSANAVSDRLFLSLQILDQRLAFIGSA